MSDHEPMNGAPPRAAAVDVPDKPLSEQEDTDSSSRIMPYIDRLVSAAGGSDSDESDNDDDDFSPSISEESEDLFEYDSDVSLVQLLEDDYKPPTQNSDDISDLGKKELIWRSEKDASFSDWTVEVTIEGRRRTSRASKRIYYVHRATLAAGVRKCGYFEALFKSDFKECTDKTSRVVLPDHAADAFPDFLDYLYAPLQERDRKICFENVKSLHFLARYFLAQKLTDDVKEFIKEDMNNLDHMETYLSLLVESNDDVESKEMLPHAVRVCGERIVSIKEGTTFLFTLPPAIFLQIITNIDQSSTTCEQKNHICRLTLSYIQHHKESLDEFYFSALTDVLCFPSDDDLAGLVAYELLEISKERGWFYNCKCNRFHQCSLWSYQCSLCSRCIPILSNYLVSKNVTFESEDAIELFDKLPKEVVVELFVHAIKAKKESLTTSEDKQEDEDDDDYDGDYASDL